MGANKDRQDRYNDLKISLLRMELEYMDWRAAKPVAGLDTTRTSGHVLDDIRSRLYDIRRCEDIVAELHALGVDP